jgi:putative protease
MKDLILAPSKFIDITNLDADSYLIGNEKFAVRLAVSFSLDEIKELRNITKKLNRNLYINVNRIFMEDEINELETYMEFLKSIDVDGIFFSDMAVFMIARQLGILDKLVYFTETQMVNYIDCQHYLDMNIKGVILSKEMTLDDILLTAKKVKGNIGMLVHGYFHMFYSKRKLLRNYFAKYGINQEPKNQYDYRLKEMTRDELYPIVETENGTNIFSGTCLSTLSDFPQLVNSSINMFIVDSIFLNEDHVKKALEYYRKMINGSNEDYASLLTEEFKDVRFSSGFLHHKIGIYK